MAALTGSRNTPELTEDKEYSYPVEATTNIYIGALVGLNAAGNAVPMSAATGLKVVGRAERVYNGTYPGQNAINNPGAAGAITITTRRGIFLFNNAASPNAVTAAYVGGPCFAVDDNTVSATDQGGTLSCAGRVVGIDISGGVWVDTRLPFAIAT